MNKELTELVYILDRSGSMQELESDTIGGFNSLINTQKRENANALVTTILFDSEVEILHDRIPLQDIPKMTDKEYYARGTTALLDAVGSTISHISNIHKYAREDDKPSKVLFTITTDGMENASKEYSYKDVKKLIDKHKELGWEFIFLGANIDAAETAYSMGIDRENAVEYLSDHAGTKAHFTAISNLTSSFLKKGSVSKDWKDVIEKDKARRGKSKKSKNVFDMLWGKT